MNRYAQALHDCGDFTELLKDYVKTAKLADRLERIYCDENGLNLADHLKKVYAPSKTQALMRSLEEEVRPLAGIRIKHAISPAECVEHFLRIQLLLEKSDADEYTKENQSYAVSKALEADTSLPNYFEMLLKFQTMKRMNEANPDEHPGQPEEVSNERQAHILAKRYAYEIESLLRLDLGMPPIRQFSGAGSGKP